MLTRLELRFFKCFELLRLPLAPLTLLTGLNASGKSSVLQALVLLHQTMREHEWSTRLVLNGAGVRLGTMPDVVDEVSGRRSFEIGLAIRSQAATLLAKRLLDDPSLSNLLTDTIRYASDTAVARWLTSRVAAHPVS